MYWIRTAFDRLVGFLPDLIGGLVILLIGYIVGRVLAAIARRVLPRLGFDRLLARLDLLDPAKGTHKGSNAAGDILFWVSMLVATMQASEVWGLGIVSRGLSAVVAYLPNVLAAAVILGAALFFGNWVRARMLHGDIAGVSTPASQRRVAAGGVRAFILAIATFMALRELRIAPEIVTIAFTAAAAAIALATALAFGLGSRSVAEKVARDWYERRRTAIDRESEWPPPESERRPTDKLPRVG